MKVFLYKANSLQTLLDQLSKKLFKPHRDVRSIFSSHGVFVSNTYGKSRLQEYFLEISPDAFVGNIRFIDWSNDLRGLLEKRASLFSKEMLSLIMGVFLKECQESEDPFFEPLGYQSQAENWFSLGSYYYELFLEYEIFAPSFRGDQFPDLFSSFPDIGKARWHWALYQKFWNFMESAFGDVGPKCLLYPQKPELARHLQKISNFHVFLPGGVLLSQLELMKDLFKDNVSLHVYILEYPALYELPGGLYQKEELIRTWKATCETLLIPYEEVELPSLSTEEWPIMKHFSSANSEREYEHLLSETLGVLEPRPSLFLDRYNVVFSDNSDYAQLSERIFSPHEDTISSHILSGKTKLKHYDIVAALRIFVNWVISYRSLEGLQEILSLHIIQDTLGISDHDVEVLLDFFRKRGGYSENPMYPLENRISYHLQKHFYKDFLDVPGEYEILEMSEEVLKFLYILLKREDKWITAENELIGNKDLEDFEEFLEIFVSSSFWREVDDPYLQRDMLSLHERLNSLREVLPNLDKVTFSMFKKFLFQDNSVMWRKENLSFVKKKGIMLGVLEDFIPFLDTYFYIPHFSESFSLFSLSLFHQESALKGQNSFIESHFKYEIWCHFLELLYTAKQVVFSYPQRDARTQSPVEPHFLISIFDSLGLLIPENDKKRIKILPKTYDNSSAIEGTTSLLPTIQYFERKISGKKLYQFLKNPLQERLKKHWGNEGDFLPSLKNWDHNNAPKFFATTKSQSKKVLERILLRTYKNPQFFQGAMHLFESSGQSGISRDSQVWTENILHEKEKVFQLLEAVEQDGVGQYYSRIFIGSYTSDNKLHRILDPVFVQDREITGELYHAYFHVGTSESILTLPNVYLKQEDLPSAKVLLHTILCGVSLQKDIQLHLAYLNKGKLAKKSYFYKYEQALKYVSNLIAKRENFSWQPLGFYDIKNHLKIPSKTNPATLWDEGYLIPIIKEMRKDYLISLQQEFLSTHRREVEQELRDMYSFLYFPDLCGESL